MKFNGSVVSTILSICPKHFCMKKYQTVLGPNGPRNCPIVFHTVLFWAYIHYISYHVIWQCFITYFIICYDHIHVWYNIVSYHRILYNTLNSSGHHRQCRGYSKSSPRLCLGELKILSLKLITQVLSIMNPSIPSGLTDLSR